MLGLMAFGCILAILPWNFPVWQIFRCAVSALMASHGQVSLNLRPIMDAEKPVAVLSVFWRHRREGLSPQEEELLDLLCGESAVAMQRESVLLVLCRSAHVQVLDEHGRRVATGGRHRADSTSHTCPHS